MPALKTEIMQRIVISRFGPVEHFETDIHDVMLFIGPQASGKSTISKAIYFFKSIKNELMQFIYEVETENFEAETRRFFERLYDRLSEYFDYFSATRPFKIEYYYSPKKVAAFKLLDRNLDWKGNIEFNHDFQQEITNILAQARQAIKSISSRQKANLPLNEFLQLEAEKRSSLKIIERYICELFEDDTTPVFIPAGRSLLATLADQTQGIRNLALDFFIRAFLKQINLLRPSFRNGLHQMIRDHVRTGESDIKPHLSLASELITNILKGEYRFEQGLEKIYYAPECAVQLNYASSGQQEAIWILLLLFKYMLDETNVFVVFEEPEAHLYPEAQKSIVELMALLANTAKNQVVVTTHSPYILSAFNNLLYAHQLGTKSPEIAQKAAHIVDSHYWIASERAAAYFMNGRNAESIIDPELRLIQAEKIDSASGLINNAFNALFDLDEYTSIAGIFDATHMRGILRSASDDRRAGSL